MLRCLIIDDEELARTLLKTYIDRLDYIEIIATLENPLEAINILKNEPIDVIFLDIQMPELKGTDLAKIIPTTTQIIFTTAYSEYALEGFELNALDYLLKPITFDRFLAAIQKIKKDPKTSNVEGKITVKSGYDLHKIKYSDVQYIESDSEYVVFHTTNKKIMSHQTLKSLEETLPEIFMRVHRSFIINKNYVTALKGKDLFLTDIRIPVSSSYYELVKNQLF
ncbi:response regulator transcription factor [Aquimarina sp. MMG015]|uniref:LytR/AlgR family response regulator transcription factor n=1 Tax=Aquimarina TaxID=290174 RepID=UPI0003FF201E|nr:MULTISPECIES: LytTR family DNA-binding domain-containing protein [Aquimarina]AXT55106.1 DNA-binding response regulator [Aquimarina sp. AD1]MBQ4802066.1 response regulator transcription factor [Aquimarina sp. MMG015]RKN12314.1 DNA-binding response regulator [Aquimarina sp. AD1]